MNRSKRNVYLLAAVLVATAACDGREHRRGSDASRATVTRNWPAAGIAVVKVIEVDGNITVEASTGNEISLLATAKGDLEIIKGQENDGLFETKLDGDTLRIGRNEREREGFHFFWEMDDVEIDYVLRVPATVSLAVTTVNGKIATRGIDGDIRATTVNGPIEVEAGGGNELVASTVNGRVRAKFTRDFQGARFKTVNGGVTATLPASASFAVNLSQVNGDFEASFPLSIHSNPGSRRVSGDVNGGTHELKITTVNGDVELAQLNGT
ncbi:MAG TPA: DUF4097 family beta strand repeat-containing protein [Thermoanaerobaculia bacterium]|nr:DUF4097 family beta strand repeat-containing protein [Thermoanaerobaculia bacterium]